MINFENNNQSIVELPSIEDIEFNPLEKSYLKVQLINSCIFYVLPLLVWTVVIIIKQDEIPNMYLYAALGVLALLLTISLVSKFIAFPYKSYGLRTQDIIYKSGLIWRNETIVPFNRIQHVEIAQGPIERRYNISKLKIFTAGGSQSDLVIPGLKDEDANNIKGFLINKIKEYV